MGVKLKFKYFRFEISKVVKNTNRNKIEMIKVYIEDKEYQDDDFTMEPLKIGNYENCIFKNCNFLSCNLSEIIFVDCEFAGCDLSMIEIDKTAFRNVNFKSSKLLGIGRSCDLSHH